jgi:hypothetical protein
VKEFELLSIKRQIEFLDGYVSLKPMDPRTPDLLPTPRNRHLLSAHPARGLLHARRQQIDFTVLFW